MAENAHCVSVVMTVARLTLYEYETAARLVHAGSVVTRPQRGWRHPASNQPKRRQKRRARCSAYHRRRAGLMLNRRLRRPSGMAFPSQVKTDPQDPQTAPTRCLESYRRHASQAQSSDAARIQNGQVMRAGRIHHKIGTTKTP